MPLARLDAKARVGDQAYDALHTAIVSGEYNAGHRLQIRDLARELGISEMPVREAIKRLEEVGLVETEPYRGAVVKQLSRQELLEIYNVRKLLEVEATRLGIAQMTEARITKAEKLLVELERSLADNDVVAYLDLDEAILLEIYTASKNSVLVENIQSLWNRCRVYKIVGAREGHGPATSEELLAYQRELVALMRGGKATEAAEVTGQSLDAAIARIRAAVPNETKDSDAAGSSDSLG